MCDKSERVWRHYGESYDADQFGGRSLMISAGESCSDLHVIAKSTLTAARLLDDILRGFVRYDSDAVGPHVVLMTNNGWLEWAGSRQ